LAQSVGAGVGDDWISGGLKMTETMIKDRPILFSGPMVKAILEGRKTQTRWVVNPEPKIVHAIYEDGSILTERIFRKGDGLIHCPYGGRGERLWVRETFSISPPLSRRPIAHPEAYPNIKYRATDNRSSWDDGPWKPSTHMPRCASRILLEVVSVRVERVREISREDALAEGIGKTEAGRYHAGLYGPNPLCDYPQEAFRVLWDSINAERGYSWEANPYVWVVEFKVLEPAK
jgi:hypothetical protein